MTNIEGNKLIAEFMGFPKPVVGSLWNYDSSLDNSTETRNLEIEDIDDRGYVKFKQKMAFERYGLSYFDGRVFDSNVFYLHKPCNKYHTSWDWLMQVVEKIKNLTEPTPKEMNINQIVTHFKIGNIVINFCEITYINRRLSEWTDRTKNIPCDIETFTKTAKTLIEAVYEAIIQFIQWLNNQKPIV